MHLVVPSPILPTSGIAQLAGPFLILTGVAIVAWSVIAVRDNDLARPSALTTRGPYALSRNPMYLGWIALCTGLALIVNSVWMAVATAGAWIYLHTVTIPREEESLLGKFGAQYEAYRKQVRRYL